MTKRVRLSALKSVGETEPDAEAVAPTRATATPKATSAPHVSVYIHPAVIKAFKQLALDTDQKVHDLYLEGFDMVLRKYGRPSIAETVQKVER